MTALGSIGGSSFQAGISLPAAHPIWDDQTSVGGFRSLSTETDSTQANVFQLLEVVDAIEAIAQLNGIDPALLYGPQVATVATPPAGISPGGANAASASAGGAVAKKPAAEKPAEPKPDAPKPYSIKSGDTLSEIARDHGTTWQKIYAIPENKAAIGSNPDKIQVGTKLVMP